MSVRAAVVLLGALSFAGASTRAALIRAPPTSTGGAARTLSNLPPRPDGALGGTAFVQRLDGLPEGERQDEILKEILGGNVPDFLRVLTPVALRGVTPDGKGVTATVHVTPDYMAIGSDSDFVRVPMDLPTAMEVARALDLRLPTRKIVDAVFAQAEVRLTPIPMTPGPRMRSPDYILGHNRSIERARSGRRLGSLTAGQKKDLVLSRRLRQRPGRVAIYGWHRTDGTPIQPLSTVHGATYADYSHGVRFVAPAVTVDGVLREYFEVLGDPRVAPVLSAEGGIEQARGLQGGSNREAPEPGRR